MKQIITNKVFFYIYYIYQIILNIIFFISLIIPTLLLVGFSNRSKRSIIFAGIIKTFYPIFFKLIFLKLTLIDKNNILNKNKLKSTLFISNHIHALDPFMIGQYLPKNTIWIAKNDILKYPIIGKILNFTGIMLWVDPKVKNFIKDLNKISNSLKTNNNKPNIGCFPEGRVSKSKNIIPFKSGPFYLATKEKIPICLIYIEKNTKGLSINPFLLDPGEIIVHVIEIIETDKMIDKGIKELRKDIFERYKRINHMKITNN